MNNTKTISGKRRGRPPGSKNKPKVLAGSIQVASITEQSTVVVPKRRGRPPGSKNRPKEQPATVSAKSQTSVVTSEGVSCVIPKRRGRPPVSKNKTSKKVTAKVVVTKPQVIRIGSVIAPGVVVKGVTLSKSPVESYQRLRRGLSVPEESREVVRTQVVAGPEAVCYLKPGTKVRVPRLTEGFYRGVVDTHNQTMPHLVRVMWNDGSIQWHALTNLLVAPSSSRKKKLRV